MSKQPGFRQPPYEGESEAHYRYRTGAITSGEFIEEQDAQLAGDYSACPNCGLFTCGCSELERELSQSEDLRTHVITSGATGWLVGEDGDDD